MSSEYGNAQRKFSPRKSYFCQIAKVFSLESFLLYGIMVSHKTCPFIATLQLQRSGKVASLDVCHQGFILGGGLQRGVFKEVKSALSVLVNVVTSSIHRY